MISTIARAPQFQVSPKQSSSKLFEWSRPVRPVFDALAGEEIYPILSTNDLLEPELETDSVIEWINENLDLVAAYAGEWVIIDNYQILGHSVDFIEASEMSQRLGSANAVLFPVIDSAVSL